MSPLTLAVRLCSHGGPAVRQCIGTRSAFLFLPGRTGSPDPVGGSVWELGEWPVAAAPPLAILMRPIYTVVRSHSITRLEPENIAMEVKTMCRIPGMQEMLKKFQGGWCLNKVLARAGLGVLVQDRSIQS